jgi:hypothetical protein
LEAVRNANYKIDDLMELAHEKHAFETLIAEEIGRIREGLYNVKVLSLMVHAPSSLTEDSS